MLRSVAGIWFSTKTVLVLCILPPLMGLRILKVASEFVEKVGSDAGRGPMEKGLENRLV